MSEVNDLHSQITLSNNLLAINEVKNSLTQWAEAYFKYEVTTSQNSRKEQLRDIKYFVEYLFNECGNDNVDNWTPRLSSDYKMYIRNAINEKGGRRWTDRTINRMIASLKTFSKWIQKYRPFTLGNPMEKIKTVATASLLNIERAITNQERRRILDSADLLIEIGGLSKDRKRYKAGDTKRPKRINYRPWRNRAVVYTLIETGMRRGAVTNINIEDVDIKNRTIKVLEKGDVIHEYTISKEGISSINDYIEKEREPDHAHYKSDILFLPAHNTQNKNGRLHPNAINDIWNAVIEKAGVENKTPHSARHAMGRHIILKSGNISAVQRQLGHRNPAYSMQYSRITKEELDQVINDR